MTSFERRNHRLVTRERLEQARAAWAAGEFSDEWEPWRKLAEWHGILGPPEGSGWDQWDDASPSQRAVLIRAIRETPRLLRAAIEAPGAPTWGKVVALLVRARDDWRERQGLDEDEWERRARLARDRAESAVAMERIGTLLGRQGAA